MNVFLWPLEGCATNCEHNTDVLSYHKVDMVNMLANSCLFTQPADMKLWAIKPKQ